MWALIASYTHLQPVYYGQQHMNSALAQVIWLPLESAGASSIKSNALVWGIRSPREVRRGD